MTLMLPGRLAAQIAAEAKAAFPRECCGLLEGRVQGGTWQVSALHPGRNISSTFDAFEIDPADHFAAARAARSRGMRLIGCYHSHPGGPGEPSARDLTGAGQENFVWLIAAQGELAAFVYSAGDFTPVGVATGADLVTSSL